MWPFDRSEEDKEKDNQAHETASNRWTCCCVCDCPFEVEDMIVRLYKGEKHSEGVYVRNSAWAAAFVHVECANPSTSHQ